MYSLGFKMPFKCILVFNTGTRPPIDGFEFGNGRKEDHS